VQSTSVTFEAGQDVIVSGQFGVHKGHVLGGRSLTIQAGVTVYLMPVRCGHLHQDGQPGGAGHARRAGHVRPAARRRRQLDNCTHVPQRRQLQHRGAAQHHLEGPGHRCLGLERRRGQLWQLGLNNLGNLGSTKTLCAPYT
jgi:hypothetical protein